MEAKHEGIVALLHAETPFPQMKEAGRSLSTIYSVNSLKEEERVKCKETLQLSHPG